MAVTDYLQRPEIEPRFFVQIGGIPRLFGCLPLPGDWDDGSGTVSFESDTYEWSDSLVITDDFGTVTQRVEPKRGLGSAGKMTLTFRLTGTNATSAEVNADAWMDLLVRDLTRTDKVVRNLTASVDSDDTIFTLNDTTDLTTDDTLHLGTEACPISSIDSGTQVTVTRGAFGSWAQTHLASVESEDASLPSLPAVTTWPSSLRGRLMRVFMAFGTTARGTWRPYSDPDGAAVQEVFAGPVQTVGEGSDTLAVTVEAASLEHYLSQQIATRLPRGQAQPMYTPTPRALPDYIHIGPHNWWLSWQFEVMFEDTVPAGNELYVVRNAPLQYGGSDVSEDRYPISAVAQMIAETMDAFSVGGSPYADHTCDIKLRGAQGSGDERYEVAVAGLDDTNAEDYRLSLYPEMDGKSSLLVDLGFTRRVDAEAVAAGSGGNDALFSVLAQQAPLLFRWPRLGLEAEPTPLLYLDRVTGPSFTASPGWTDDDGDSIGGYVRLADYEIMRFSAVTTLSDGTVRLTIAERGVFGTGSTREDLVIKPKKAGQTQPTVDVVQGIALPNTSVGRALLYLWSSGSGVAGTVDATYDQAWHGSGLGLPGTLIDTDGIVALDRDLDSQRDQIWIDQATPLRDWVSDEIVLLQVLCVSTANWSTGSRVRVTLIDNRPALEASAARNSRTLDATNTRTLGGQGIGLDRDESKIVNNIEAEAGYDPASGDYSVQIYSQQYTSIATYGRSQTSKLKIRNQSSAGDANALVRDVAERYWGNYAYPYTILEITGAHAETWSWQVGDDVQITNAVVPTPSLPGRGLTAAYGKVFVKSDNLFPRGGGSSRLTMVLRQDRGQRFTEWAPSARGTSIAVTGVIRFETVITVDEHAFSANNEAVDSSYFEAGDEVHVQIQGTTTTVTATVSSVTDTQIRLIGDLSGTLGTGSTDVLITFAGYDDADLALAQRAYAYWSDGDGVLDKDNGTDGAFSYV